MLSVPVIPVNCEPSPLNAAAVTVPVVCIPPVVSTAVLPPIVPDITALPETFPAVVIAARFESLKLPVTCVPTFTLLLEVSTFDQSTEEILSFVTAEFAILSVDIPLFFTSIEVLTLNPIVISSTSKLPVISVGTVQSRDVPLYLKNLVPLGAAAAISLDVIPELFISNDPEPLIPIVVLSYSTSNVPKLVIGPPNKPAPLLTDVTDPPLDSALIVIIPVPFASVEDMLMLFPAIICFTKLPLATFAFVIVPSVIFAFETDPSAILASIIDPSTTPSAVEALSA